MSTSMSYWNISEATRDALRDINAVGEEMHTSLESNDDAGEVADFLVDIEKRLLKLAAQVGPNISPLRKVAKSLEDLPGMKS